MQMFYGDIEYTLVTDPPEAMYWKTYKLKKSHIKLIDKFDRTTAARIKQEIYEDILANDPDAPTLPARGRFAARQR